MINLGVLAPHPPIIVPGIGSISDLEQVSDTIQSMKEIDDLLAQDPPETLVVFTPHGTVFSDAIVIYGDEELKGGLSRFGLDRTWQWRNDLELARKIVDRSQAIKIPVLEFDQNMARRYRPQGALDHGVLVPLSCFSQNWVEKVKLVIIPLSYLPLEELYLFGSVIPKAAAEIGRKVAIIASGDLSHCLKSGAPAGYDPRGAEFDRKLIEILKNTEFMELFRINPVLLEKAAECGFRSVVMLMGALDQLDIQIKVHSYQGPFGVGYGVVSFKPTGHSRQSMMEDIFNNRDQSIAERRKSETPIVRYARQVVEDYVQGNPLKEPDDLGEIRNQKAGVFVSIKKHGQLRGCIGTTEPTQKNIVAEIEQNAISASTKDPRFEPVDKDELKDLMYSVDVLKPAEPIRDFGELDPKRYGVIVTQGYRRGLLLPNLEGIETAEEQVAIAKRKAGIPEDGKVDLERFEVVRYH